MSMQDSALKASWLDSLLVFAMVIAVGSVCSLVLLRDLDRYWKSVRGALEKVHTKEGAKAKAGGKDRAPPEPDAR